jgi:hypothetical protein
MCNASASARGHPCLIELNNPTFSKLTQLIKRQEDAHENKSLFLKEKIDQNLVKIARIKRNST